MSWLNEQEKRDFSARIEPEIKEQVETILDKSGLSVSTLINTLYRQIIKTGGVPYALYLHKISTLGSMNT